MEILRRDSRGMGDRVLMCCFLVPLPLHVLLRSAGAGSRLPATYGIVYTKIKISVDFSCVAVHIAVEKVVKIIPKKQLLQIK